MSPSSPRRKSSDAASRSASRLFVLVGAQVRDERLRRRWTLRELSARARLSASGVQAIESGQAGSLDSYARLAAAVGLTLEIDLADPRRRRQSTIRARDTVHAAMGEFEARHLRPFRFGAGIDEPYRHHQFAGRADLVVWERDRAALLHIENRTRFPDLQDTAASFNAKRAYLGEELAARLGLQHWNSETHVMVALWSAEVLHSLRLHEASLRSLCPDPPLAFASWWAGRPPESGRRSELAVLDPLATGRQRTFISLDAALGARPRHRDYAQAAARLLSAASLRDAA